MPQYIRLYRFHTNLVPGLYEVFYANENGTFTSGTFLSVFAAPSFTLWALQGVIDACLFVSPLVIVAAISGKWVLGHFTESNDEDGPQTRRRPLHDWPKHSSIACAGLQDSFRPQELVLL
ncbi:hypothetical protein K503DRAFT_806053 [Rhizopogon vinicolor AM-OR11-026]|uniref:Uncharacterized protein n=1 Tax=Rhizopogon vinicolor AM-OR11-026 TaxID=1314800 RepID=A0A1B7MFU0_9AGAM|nr:hypothetical protein K503DRAFT_806053 [Rhizopogon vinicolor AM-OR11-026]